MSFSDIIDAHHGNSTGFARHYLLLYALVLGLEAKKVFEFGAGFSSMTILEALRHTNGKLTSCEIRSKNDIGLNKHQLMTTQDKSWTYLQGNSQEVVPELKEKPFELVLHDGSHETDVVTKDIRNIIPLMCRGGILLIHDTTHHKLQARMVRGVKQGLRDVKHSALTLPYGYGLTIIVVESGTTKYPIKTNWQKQTSKTVQNPLTKLIQQTVTSSLWRDNH